MTKKNDPIEMEAQPVGFFETPVAYARLKDSEALLQELENTIMRKRISSEGVTRSNIGGWHSNTDMLKWGGEAAQKVAESAINLAKRMSHFEEGSPDDYDWPVRMWANVTEQGGLNHLHAHPGNLWAAVLYVNMGTEEGNDAGGNFYIEDPRFPMNLMRNTAFRTRGTDGQPQQLQPEFNLKRGNLVLFPAWLRHGVRSYTGSRLRISIAMNIDAQQR